jgi:hypothetical protein
MKSGDLVKIKRAGIGVPEDTLGLIIRCSPTSMLTAKGLQICEVSPLGTHRIVRRIDWDLEVINKGS